MSDRKRVCFVINKLTDGGAERVTSLLSSYFSKEDIFDVEVVTFEIHENEYSLDKKICRTNIELVQPMSAKNLLLNFIKSRKILLSLNCDCYIGIDIFANFIVSFLGATSKKRTII